MQEARLFTPKRKLILVLGKEFKSVNSLEVGAVGYCKIKGFIVRDRFEEDSKILIRTIKVGEVEIAKAKDI